jgi:hypothetical protein
MISRLSLKGLGPVTLFPTIFCVLAIFVLAASAQMPAVKQPAGKTSGANSPSSKPPAFLPVVTYDSGGSGAASVTVADVNHDGKPDLVVANNWNCPSANCATNGVVGVLLGNGDGTFRPVVPYNSGGAVAVSVVVADVNGDGEPDLIVAHQCPFGGCIGQQPTGVVTVLLGNGNGTFKPALPYALTGLADTLVVADVNGDGKLDLVVAIYGGQADVLLGNGDGTFKPAAVNSGLGSSVSSLAVADSNGDGKLDLLLGSAYSCENNICGQGQIGVLAGDGNGAFQSPRTDYGSGGNWADSIAAADVNDDGKADLIVANHCSVWSGGVCSGPGSLGVLLGNGDGTFQNAKSYNSSTLIYPAVTVADVNGDSKPDLVAVGCLNTSPTGFFSACGGHTDASLQILTGNNDGTFQPAVSFDAGGAIPSSVAVADLNGDGKPDAVVAISYSSQGTDGLVGVLLNISGTSATTTTVSASPNPCSPNQLITVTATVTSQSGPAPTGSVVFLINGVAVASTGVENNQALITTSFGISHHGANWITANYLGDANNAPSMSPQFEEDVQVLSISELNTSASPVFFGQPVTFTATAYSRQLGYGANDGELMNFYDAKTFLASVPLVHGSAVFTTSSLKAEHHTIKVTYGGDAGLKPSQRSIVQVVNKYASATSLTSSPNPSVQGQGVTFTATVTPSGPNQATGKVKFLDGTAGLGVATLSGGVATLTKSKLAAGTHSITAQYLGDAASADSTSNAVEQVVNPE